RRHRKVATQGPDPLGSPDPPLVPRRSFAWDPIHTRSRSRKEPLMSSRPNPIRHRPGRRLLATAGALTVTATLLLAGPANAEQPKGSLGEVILEAGDVTGHPAFALRKGWWGHEGAPGPGALGTTFVSMDVTDGKGSVSDATIAALHSEL